MPSTSVRVSKPPKHVWAKEERQWLDACVKCLDGNRSEVVRAWNKRFNQHLPASTLFAQYAELRKGSSYWAGLEHSEEYYTAKGYAAEILSLTGQDLTALPAIPTSEGRHAWSGPQSAGAQNPGLTQVHQRGFSSGNPPSDSKHSESFDLHDPPSPSPRRRQSAATKEILPARRQKGTTMSMQEIIQLARQPRPYDPIPAEEAHRPLSSLVYRFYDEDATYGINKPLTQGFIAGRFQYINGGIPPPPMHTDPIVFTEIEIHINRDSPVTSPFISVSDGLIWCFRQASKKIQQDPSVNLRVAFIDGKAIEKGAFHVPPYHKQLKERKVFDKGQWRYGARSEYLVWGTIPSSATIADFAFADLRNLCQTPELATMLQLETLTARGTTDNLLRQIKACAPELNAASVKAMANVVAWLGQLSVRNLQSQHVTKLVGDLVRGWHLRPAEALSYVEWTALAEHFVDCLDTFTIGRTELQKAFLFGVMSGLGNINWRYEPRLERAMWRNARAFGLASPDEMIRPDGDPAALIRAFALTEMACTPSQSRVRVRNDRSIRGVETVSRHFAVPPSPPSTPTTRTGADSTNRSRHTYPYTPKTPCPITPTAIATAAVSPATPFTPGGRLLDCVLIDTPTIPRCRSEKTMQPMIDFAQPAVRIARHQGPPTTPVRQKRRRCLSDEDDCIDYRDKGPWSGKTVSSGEATSAVKAASPRNPIPSGRTVSTGKAVSSGNAASSGISPLVEGFEVIDLTGDDNESRVDWVMIDTP